MVPLFVPLIVMMVSIIWVPRLVWSHLGGLCIDLVQPEASLAQLKLDRL